MAPAPLVQHFDLIAQAPGGVARLRELILTLAVQGKLVPQDPSDEPASELLKKIRAEKDRLIAEGKIKRDKPLAEIADEEKSFELPHGWEWVRIPEITYGLGQGEPKAAFTYIDVAAIDNAVGLITHDVGVLEAADAPSRARKNVTQGTVIYSTVRPYLKNIAIVEHQYVPRAIASTAFAVLHPHTGVLSKYLLHYLRSQPFTDFVNSKAVGVAYPAINDANFFQGIVPLPPLAEQSRIVTRVKELMQVCDALEASGQLEAQQHAQLVNTLLGTLTQSETPEALADNWQRIATHFDVLLDRPEAVDALEQTILQLAVRGLLVPQDPADEPASVLLQKIRIEKDHLIAQGKIKRDKPLPPITDEEKPFELPQGWVWGRLRELVTHLGDGLHGTPNYSLTGDYFFVNGNNLGEGVITIKPETKRVDQSEFDKHRKPLNATTVLVSINGTLGRVAFYQNEKIILGKSACYFNVTPGLEKLFVKLLLECPDFMTYAIRSATGTTIKNLGLKAIGDWPIALPPLAEQSRIVTRVNELRSLCVDLRHHLAAGQAVQAHLADALVST
jgi:type I restriction enzyme, S subunit